MLWKLGFLTLIATSIVSVVLSTNIVVVRRLNPNTNDPHFADWFSNRQCPSSTCPSDRSTCAGGRCCMCQCLYDYPNVFVSRTTASLRCTNYDEINSLSSANCQYSFRKPNEPLEVIAITEVASGKIRFKNDSARVNCTENGLTVEKWEYLDVDGRLKNGDGNVFNVDFRTVGGHDGNKKDLTFLNWNAKLDAKYAGLIIRISLGCAGTNVGCVLAKINGTYTYNTLQSTTTTPQQPSTDPTTTQDTPTTFSTTSDTPTAPQTAPPAITDTPTIPDTSPNPVPEETTALPLPETNEAPAPGTTPGLSPSETIQSSRGTNVAPSRSAEQQQGSEERVAGKNVTTPTLAALVGLICLIALVCLIVLLYKRRKKRSSEQAADPKVDSEAKLEDYQDPVYAELPDNTNNAGDFDNPIYSDPTEEQIAIRRSRQDPLPALPTDEATYQPLDQNTRTVPGVSPPTPPPAPSDYLNPDREEPDTVDYDNPPVTNQVPLIHNESSDYDNPPVQGNNPPMSTQSLQNMNNESSDYDNPPIQGNSPGSPTEAIPEATDVDVPEYFELEPPEDSHL